MITNTPVVVYIRLIFSRTYLRNVIAWYYATLYNAEIEFVLGDAADQLNEYGGIGATLHYSVR